MRAFSIIALLASSLGIAQAEAVRYSIGPVFTGGKLRALAIEVAFTGEVDGETEVVLPSAWGGATELWRGVSRFQVDGASRVTDGNDAARRLIHHPPGAGLILRYRVRQLGFGEPDTVEYRPIIRDGYFQIIGWTALVRPDWTLTTPTFVSFEGFPKKWKLASDLEHGELTLNEALKSVSVGGDFRVLKDGPLTVAIRGAWTFSDANFVGKLSPIIGSHHRFWGDRRGPYLVTLLPIVGRPNSSMAGGTGLGDAFAFFATTNVDDKRMLNGLAHEHMHSWIPLKLGATPEANQGVADSWFSEGFTDYYTYRLFVRDGLATVEDTVKMYNEFMWDYAFSPARAAPNAKIVDAFWSDQAMQRMPYQRGLLVAALADDQLRRVSDGARDLDDVVLRMKQAVDAAGGARPAIRDHFIAAMQTAGIDFRETVQRVIEQGEAVLLPREIWAACGFVETEEVAEFDRGFKGRLTLENGGVVVGVDPDGPAYAAGLRGGMRILNFKPAGGRDSRVPLTYRVLVGGEVREISYLPQGKRRVTLQELKLREFDAAARSACAARLGGLS